MANAMQAIKHHLIMERESLYFITAGTAVYTK